MSRSHWKVIPLTLALIAAAASAQAAEPAYPTKPVRIIVPYPPGGTTDPTARAFTGWFAEKTGATFVIDNRPGAGSTLGHGLGAKATPDGYTLLLGTSGGLVVSAAFGSKLAYDPVKDFAPIGVGVYVPFLIVVHPSVPAKNVKELVDLAKTQPGKINFASPGTGTPNHLGVELLTSLTGAKFTHVPYKGGGAATVDVLAGRVQAIALGGVADAALEAVGGVVGQTRRHGGSSGTSPRAIRSSASAGAGTTACAPTMCTGSRRISRGLAGPCGRPPASAEAPPRPDRAGHGAPTRGGPGEVGAAAQKRYWPTNLSSRSFVPGSPSRRASI